MNCLCCMCKKLVEAIKGISVSCDVQQPLEISGTIKTDVECNIPQPLEVSGNICQFPQPLIISGTIATTCDIPQPLVVSGTITTVSTDACAEAMAKILSQSSNLNEIVFKNGEQFQNITEVVVDGNIVTLVGQKQKIQTTLCNIEYVVTE